MTLKRKCGFECAIMKQLRRLIENRHYYCVFCTFFNIRQKYYFIFKEYFFNLLTVFAVISFVSNFFTMKYLIKKILFKLNTIVNPSTLRPRFNVRILTSNRLLTRRSSTHIEKYFGVPFYFYIEILD